MESEHSRRKKKKLESNTTMAKYTVKERQKKKKHQQKQPGKKDYSSKSPKNLVRLQNNHNTKGSGRAELLPKTVRANGDNLHGSGKKGMGGFVPQGIWKGRFKKTGTPAGKKM